MNNLKNRVKKLENQVGLEIGEDGIPKWAMNYAENRAYWETYNRPHFKKMWEIVEEIVQNWGHPLASLGQQSNNHPAG